MYFDYVGKRKIWFLISLLIIIPGIISLFFQGLNYGIDFEGGTKVIIQAPENITSEEIRGVLSEYNLERSIIQETEENQFIIRTPVLTNEENTQMLNALHEKIGPIEILSNESVGEVVSAELKNKALIATAIAMVLIIVYITIRFEISFAISAIIALMLDVLVTLSIFSIFQFEIDAYFIAAILTIIGYSINNTIVVFDRIRENMSFKEKIPLSELVNKSTSQSLTRTINTSITTIAVLVALFVFGGETTRIFSGAMIIGLTSGAYTTIFITGSMWIELKNRGFGGNSRKGKRKKPSPAPSR